TSLLTPLFRAAIPYLAEGFGAPIVSDENVAIGWRRADNALGLVVAAGHVFATAGFDHVQSLGQDLVIAVLIFDVDLSYGIDRRGGLGIDGRPASPNQQTDRHESGCR